MSIKSLISILLFTFSLHASTDSLALPLTKQAPATIQLLWKQGLDAHENDHFNKGILLIDSSLCLLQNEHAWAHPLSAVAMNHLGNIYFDNAYIGQAYFYHSEALRIRETYFGLQHLETAKSYNNLANCHLAIGDYETAVRLYQETLRIRRNNTGVPQQELASVYNNLGNCYLSLGTLIQAKKHYEQALIIRQNVLGESDIKTAQSKLSLGNIYAALQQPDSALVYFESSRVVFEHYYEQADPKLANLYENIGNALVAQQRFLEAEILLGKALVIRQNAYSENHPSCIPSYQNIGDLWLQRGDYQQAQQYFNKALDLLLKRWGEYHPQVAQAYEQLALALLYQGKIEEAKSNFLQSTALRQSIFGVNHPYVAGSWLNLGNVFWQEGKYQEARQYFEQSLTIWSLYGAQWQFDQLKAYLNISETYLEEGQIELAQLALKQAKLFLDNDQPKANINYLLKTGKVQQLLGNYEKADQIYKEVLTLLKYDLNNDTKQSVSLEILLCLQSKAENLLLFAMTANDAEIGKNALFFFEAAMDGLAILQTTYSKPEARQQMTALHQLLFEGAIECCFFLGKMTQELTSYHLKALIFSERNKSIRLLEADFSHQSNENGNQNWQHTLSNLNQLFLDEEKIVALQAKLNPETSILSFFHGQKNKYVFIFNKENIYAQQLNEQYPWQDAISNLGKSIIQYPDVNSSEQLRMDSIYRLNALDLYEQLLKPLHPYIKGKDHLLIIPDGIFNWLPFETLLSSEPVNLLKYRSYPYLIHDYTISYAYSISQWFNEQNKPIITVNTSHSCLAIAPEFKDPNAEFTPLKYNLSEAKGVLSHFQGKLLEGSMASRTQFLSQAGAYAILHFATHGQTNIYDGDYAFLVLGADSTDAPSQYSKLFVKDLYAQRWKAQLAVLSACETGVGSFRLGEGVISLGRGFAQAGVRSSVSSLWHINDAKTAQLMAVFYQYLKEGHRKDDALQQAKLSQLMKGSQEAAHPFYWAGYLPYGDMQPIKTEASFFNWWFLVAVFLLIGGLLTRLWT